MVQNGNAVDHLLCLWQLYHSIFLRQAFSQESLIDTRVKSAQNIVDKIEADFRGRPCVLKSDIVSKWQASYFPNYEKRIQTCNSSLPSIVSYFPLRTSLLLVADSF